MSLRTALLTALAALSVGASAEVLTPAEALGRLGAAGPRRVAARLERQPLKTFRAGGNDPAFYLFRAGEGFMAVSAESRTPALLAYSETCDPTGEIPPAMEFLLDSYAEEIAALRASGAAPAAAAETPAMAAIEPICKTRWDQLFPYYTNCPIDPKTGNRCVTGCVATAAAQVLKHYEHPAQCNGGVETYDWEYGERQLSLDFDTVAPFKWEEMRNGYYNSQTAPEVARLMNALGHAAHMNFTPGASGAHGEILLAGLVKHFGYDATATYENRSWYTPEEWVDKVYAELASGHPLYYDGFTADFGAGHAFVVDGYDGAGLFHVNWGWSGISNGYFLLSALDPAVQGTGGSDSGYSRDQGAIFGLRPAETDPADVPMNFFMNAPMVPELPKVRLGERVKLCFNDQGGIFNNGPLEADSVHPAVSLTPREGGDPYVTVSGARYRGLPVHYGFADFTVMVPAGMPEGTYTLAPAIYDPGRGYWFPVAIPMGRGYSLPAVVAGDSIYFSAAELPELEASEIACQAMLAPGDSLAYSATVSNVSALPYDDPVVLALLDGEETLAEYAPVHALLSPGQGRTVAVSAALPAELPEGTYTLRLRDANGRLLAGSHALTVTNDPTTGIAPPSAPEADAEYFDLAGRRVGHPENRNLYIRRQGGKTDKICR